jgi:hypothetical protein
MVKIQGMTSVVHKARALIPQYTFQKKLMVNIKCVHSLRFKVFSNIGLTMFIHRYKIAFVKAR